MDALLAGSAHGGKRSTSLLLGQLGDLRMDDKVPADLPLQVLTVGLRYGNQSAVVEDMMVDTVALPVAALEVDSPVHDLVLSLTDQADQLRQAANHLVDDLRAATRTEKLPWDKGEHLGDVLLHALTPVVRRLLTGLQREPERVEAADAAWRGVARRTALEVAEPVVAAASSVAFLGRVEGKYAYRLSAAYGKYRGAITKILGPPAAPSPPDTAPDLAGAAR
jgi:CRISPR system Cascade subunit CasA